MNLAQGSRRYWTQDRTWSAYPDMPSKEPGLQGEPDGSVFRTSSLPSRQHMREVVIEQLSPSTKRLRITEGDPESSSGPGHVLLTLPARSPPDHAAAWPGEEQAALRQCALPAAACWVGRSCWVGQSCRACCARQTGWLLLSCATTGWPVAGHEGPPPQATVTDPRMLELADKQPSSDLMLLRLEP